MGEVIQFGFHRRRSPLNSKTVDILLKIISLCADDHQESPISNLLPIASDDLNSDVRRNDSENALVVKDKSVESVLGENGDLSFGNDIIIDDYSIEIENLLIENVNCSIEDNLLSSENVEPLGVEDLMNVDEDGSDKLEKLHHRIVEEIKVAGEAHQEEIGQVKPVNLDSSVCDLTDMDVEDGEIPDGLGIYNELVDIVNENLASTEDKIAGKDQTHHDVTKERGVGVEHQEDTGAHEKYMSSTCSTQEEIMEKKKEGKLNRNLKRSYGDALVLEAGNSGKENGEASVDSATKKVCLSDRKLVQGYADDWLQDAGTSEKENGDTKEVETSKKKTKEKRVRVVSKERKAKKKMNERKKRAQTRREQGVKRLRIEPQISKPKPPKYCEFYLKGRCHKGDSCKFSHDTTPLTKSQPCKFLALQQCLKGDDCPFDHQLSKYPCNNYASSGFCIRGNKCLFSHKIAEIPLPPSNVTSPKAASQPSPNNLNAKRNQTTVKIPLLTVNSTASGASLKTPSSGASLKIPSSTGTQVLKNPEQNVLGKPRPLAQPPKGVTLLSFGSSLIDSSKKTPLAQPPKGVTLLSFGNSPLIDSSKKTASNVIEASTQKDQEWLRVDQNSNELLQKRPSTPASSSQYSLNSLQNSQNKNSARMAPSSTSGFAAKYETEMMKNRSKFPTGLSTSTNSSKTPGSSASSTSIDNIQNRLMKVSPLLQEFLFGFGDGK